MNQLKEREKRLSLEDLMYVSVLDKFMELGVEMMPRLEVIPDSSSTIHALTSGIHSAEALDMVKDHVRSIMGQAAMAFPNTMLQMSKLQAAQVWSDSWPGFPLSVATACKDVLLHSLQIQACFQRQGQGNGVVTHVHCR